MKKEKKQYRSKERSWLDQASTLKLQKGVPELLKDIQKNTQFSADKNEKQILDPLVKLPLGMTQLTTKSSMGNVNIFFDGEKFLIPLKRQSTVDVNFAIETWFKKLH